MIRNIVCSFEEKSIMEIAISTLYNEFRGEIRISYSLPANYLAQNSILNSAAYEESQFLTIQCTQKNFDRVVEKLVRMGAQSIRY